MQQVVTYSARRRSMATRLHRILLITVIAILVSPTLAPAQRPAVLVNPHVQGNGRAKRPRDRRAPWGPDGGYRDYDLAACGDPWNHRPFDRILRHPWCRHRRS